MTRTLNPSDFVTTVRTDKLVDAPLVLGNEIFVHKYATHRLRLVIDSREYQVPTGCPGPVDDYPSLLSPCAGLVHFPEYINPVRLGSSNTYMSQAICLPMCTYQASMSLTPLYNEPMIMYPPLVSTEEGVGTTCIPGRNLNVVFVNTELTYEDGMLLSRSAARKFSYRAQIT